MEYYNVPYDNEALGPFVAEDANVTWTGGVGFIVTLIDLGTTGRLVIGLVSGVAPTDNLVLTQGTTTADADGDARLMLYPAYFREDIAVAAGGACTWTGPALGATHSFFFDGQTGNVIAGDILEFVDGQLAEVITVESDAGATGELSVRFISNLDAGLPDDNDTFDNGAAGDGIVNGMIHQRAYSPLHLHRLLSDLNDDEDIQAGGDDLSRVDPTASGKDTDKIVNLLGDVTITDAIAQHMYDGSISQAAGDTLYSGANIQVTSPNADTQPILIQNDAIITDYWKNAYMPHSIDGTIRILKKTRHNGVDIDGKRLRGVLAEFGHLYFMGGTTLGTGWVALSLFSSPDGNNATAEGTVSAYSPIQIEGFQLVDYNNGNGNTEYAYKIDYDTENALQTYEYTKYIQRRGTAETLFGRNASLFIGINLNFAYSAEVGALAEDEIVAWGTEVVYSVQAVSNFVIDEVVNFSPSGAKGRVIYDNDAGVTGTIIISIEGTIIPDPADTILAVDSGTTADVDSVVANTNYGTALLVAKDDDGATGNLYCQQLTGLIPASGQEIYGRTSDGYVTAATPSTRTVNNQYIGNFTGTNFQTNYGFAIDPSDAVVGDKLRNLADVQQEPPNNQSGTVTGLKAYDTVTCYPWDGTSYDAVGDPEPNYNEATLTTALTTASTEAIVSAIPDNTPASGFLRIERDSDHNLDLVEYSAYSGLTYTLVGTAPSAAAIGNDVMRAFIDKEMLADGNASYTAVKGAGDTQVVAKTQNAYGSVHNGPIKPSSQTPTFGSSGFSVGASRISDA